MSNLSNLSRETRSRILEAVQDRSDVDSAIFDDHRGILWVLCAVAADAATLESELRDRIRAIDVAAADAPMEVVIATARRVRLLEVDRRETHDGTHVRIRITLAWGDRQESAEGESGKAAPLELRVAAGLTLDVLSRIVEGDLDVRLIGIKQVRAFDADLVVASLMQPGPPSRPLVGAVLQTDTPARAAVMAVLSALNRLLGNFLHRID